MKTAADIYAPLDLARFADEYAGVEWMLHLKHPACDRVITTDAFSESLTATQAFDWAHRINNPAIGDPETTATVFHFGKPANQGSWLAWSHKHGAWWAPAAWGYTHDLSEAGRYTEDEARAICERSAYGWIGGQLPPSVMVRSDAADMAAAVQEATDAAIAERGAGDRPTPEPISAVVTLRKAADQ